LTVPEVNLSQFPQILLAQFQNLILALSAQVWGVCHFRTHLNLLLKSHWSEQFGI